MKLYKLTDQKYKQDKYVLVVETGKGPNIHGPHSTPPRLYRRWVSFDETFLTLETGGSTWLTIRFNFNPDGSLKSEELAPLVKELDTVIQWGLLHHRMDQWNDQLRDWEIDLPKPTLSTWDGDGWAAVETIQR